MSLLKALHDESPDLHDQRQELDLELDFELDELGDGLDDEAGLDDTVELELEVEPLEHIDSPAAPTSDGPRLQMEAVEPPPVQVEAPAPPAPTPISAAAGHAHDLSSVTSAADSDDTPAAQLLPATFLHTRTGVTILVLVGALLTGALGVVSWLYVRDVLHTDMTSRGELQPSVIEDQARTALANAATAIAAAAGNRPDAARNAAGSVAVPVAPIATTTGVVRPAPAAPAAAEPAPAPELPASRPATSVPAEAVARAEVDADLNADVSATLTASQPLPTAGFVPPAILPAAPPATSRASPPAAKPATRPATPLATASRPTAAPGVLPAKPASAPTPAAVFPNVQTPAPAPSVPVSQRARPEPPPMGVSTRSVPSGVDAHLRIGYAHYAAGDLDAARRSYEQALLSDPLRRDAIVGLAVIHQGLGNMPAARAFYERVLEIAPGDSQAVAGLASLSVSNGYQGTESDLRALLVRIPQAPHLHAALGNLYAIRRKWPQAQQSWFQAVALDPANADYNFNLAVSLERLGKSSAAVSYYQRALDLRTDTSRFDPDVVSVRLGQLARSTW